MKRLKKELVRVMDKAVTHGETSCALTLLWRHGEEKLYCASGFADLGQGTPVERDTIFRLYSLTKPIMAVTAMALVERGDLDLNAPVSDFLEGFAHQRVAVSDTKTVPVQRPMLVSDLFSMTSGLCYAGEENPAERIMAKLFDVITAETQADNQPDTQAICNRIGQQPLAFEPGQSWHYGTSADVLGAVVEIAAGKPLDEVMAETVFAPLDMVDTGFYVPQEKQPRLATLYERRDGILSPFIGNNFGLSHYNARPNFISGGAGLVSTIDDVLRFARMLLGKGELCGKRVLSARAVEWLTQNHLNAQQLAGVDKDSMLGCGYGGLMRILLEPAKSTSLGVAGEFSWEGWAGPYMTVCPEEDLILLFFQQQADTGSSPLTRKVRNLVYAGVN